MGLIPEAILQRIEEFATLGKTGQIALNLFEGQVLSADIREHLNVPAQKSLDKSRSRQ